MRKIKNIVLHCTATAGTATVESIQRYWRESLGWKSPGYHYIIQVDGTIVQLLDIDRVSNGVAGHNSDSIHISYIGGVDSNGKAKDTRTIAQIASMKDIVWELHTMFPAAKIKGHRDFSADKNGNGIIDPSERIKECPSFDVREWILKEALTR